MHSWWSHAAILCVSPIWNQCDAPGCCCIAGGHMVMHLDAVA